MVATVLEQDPILGEIVGRLVEAFQPERIYLFGSKARGDEDEDSDYDLMVLVPDNAPPERRRSRLAYERLWGTGAAADVLVWTRDAFDCRLHLRASFPSTIVREGKLLYSACTCAPRCRPPSSVKGNSYLPHDPIRCADTRAWLEKARGDLRASRSLLDADESLFAQVCFHCQQAAEKALKGFLTWHDVPFRKTHDPGAIGRECVEIDPALESLCARAVQLAVYAWESRYPQKRDDPTRDEAREALALAEEVYRAIVARLPEDARADDANDEGRPRTTE